MAGHSNNQAFSDSTPSAEAVFTRFEKYSNETMKPAVEEQPIESEQPYNSPMENVTRPELDAKLEAIEARADARLSRFEERIEQAINEMRRDRADLKDEMKAQEAQRRSDIGKLGDEIKDQEKQRRSEMSALKLTIVTTAIGTFLALAAANIGLVQTMFAAFESGKTTQAAISQATEELKAIRAQLEEQAKDTKASTPKGK